MTLLKIEIPLALHALPKNENKKKTKGKKVNALGRPNTLPGQGRRRWVKPEKPHRHVIETPMNTLRAVHEEFMGLNPRIFNAPGWGWIPRGGLKGPASESTSEQLGRTKIGGRSREFGRPSQKSACSQGESLFGVSGRNKTKAVMGIYNIEREHKFLPHHPEYETARWSFRITTAEFCLTMSPKISPVKFFFAFHKLDYFRLGLRVALAVIIPLCKRE